MCEPTLPTGAWCTQTLDCEWGDGCMPDLNNTGRCIPFLSGAIGTKIYNESLNRFCESNHAVNYNGTAYCAAGDVI